VEKGPSAAPTGLPNEDFQRNPVDTISAPADDLPMFTKWWKYEWAVIRRAFAETNVKAYLGGGFLVGVLAYVGQMAAGLRTKHDTLLFILIGLASAVVGVLCGFLIKLFTLPAKMAGEQQEQLRILNADATQTKQRLEDEIKNLKNELDDKGNHQAIKKDLATFLDNIELRRREISAMQISEYRDQYINGQDAVSLSIVNSAEDFISRQVGFAESKLFVSLSGIQLTRFNDDLDAHGLLQDLEKFRRKQIRMMEHLDHWATQLKQLISNYN